jgi:phosphatidylglycerol lysyltransferase
MDAVEHMSSSSVADTGQTGVYPREEVLDLLRLHGRSPLSFLLRYEAPWRAFVAPEGAACYLPSEGAAVLWSDPLCAPADTEPLLRIFTRAMRAERLGICLIAIDELTAQAALSCGYSVLKVGEEPWFELDSWRRPAGNRGKNLRWCVNHARREGVTVEEADRDDPGLENELRDLLVRWEEVVGRQVARSVLRPSPFDEVDEKRIFLARRHGRLEAFAACSPIYARGGWYIEDLFRAPGAVNGASELLVVETLAGLHESGARSAALGIAPFRGSGEQLDRRARWLGRTLTVAFRYLDKRYGFASLAGYEAKFEPSTWAPRYVAFSPPWPRPRVVRAAVKFLDA